MSEENTKSFTPVIPRSEFQALAEKYNLGIFEMLGEMGAATLSLSVMVQNMMPTDQRQELVPLVASSDYTLALLTNPKHEDEPLQ